MPDRQLLFSRLGLLIGFFGLSLLFLFVMLPRRIASRSRRIIDCFAGRFAWPFGPVEFDYENMKVRILEVALRLPYLFAEKFDHLTISPELHLGGSRFIRRKSVMRYSVLPRSIYDSPELLRPILHDLFDVLNLLGVIPELENAEA